MDMRLHLLAFLLFLIEPVSLDGPVWGNKEGYVVLPCTHSGPNVSVTLPDNDITFHWRHKGKTIVHDVINGKEQLSKQNQQFKNRTRLLPDRSKGDFSLKLINLTEADSGTYTCILPQVSTDYESQAVELRIKEKPIEPIPPEPRNPPGNSSVQTCLEKSIFLLIFLLCLLSV